MNCRTPTQAEVDNYIYNEKFNPLYLSNSSPSDIDGIFVLQKILN